MALSYNKDIYKKARGLQREKGLYGGAGVLAGGLLGLLGSYRKGQKVQELGQTYGVNPEIASVFKDNPAALVALMERKKQAAAARQDEAYQAAKEHQWDVDLQEMRGRQSERNAQINASGRGGNFLNNPIYQSPEYQQAVAQALKEGTPDSFAALAKFVPFDEVSGTMHQQQLGTYREKQQELAAQKMAQMQEVQNQKLLLETMKQNGRISEAEYDWKMRLLLAQMNALSFNPGVDPSTFDPNQWGGMPQSPQPFGYAPQVGGPSVPAKTREPIPLQQRIAFLQQSPQAQEMLRQIWGDRWDMSMLPRTGSPAAQMSAPETQPPTQSTGRRAPLPEEVDWFRSQPAEKHEEIKAFWESKGVDTSGL